MYSIKNYALLFLMGFSLIFITSCGEDDSDDEPITSFGDGIFITNLNSETSLKGAISYYDRTREEVVNDIYVKKNSVPLGEEVYSMHIFNGKAYIVVANAGMVIVADPVTMETLATIDGFQLPHHFIPVSNSKAYVSQWGNDGVTGAVKVVDLNSNSITGTIPTRGGPENMIKRANSVYVAMTGGFFLDSIVTVINSTTDQISSNIAVDLVPSSMQLDANSDLWVLCRGLIDQQNSANNRAGQLMKLVNDQVDLSIQVASAASDLVIDNSKTTLYFLNPEAASWAYEHPISSTSLSTVPFIDISISHLGHDPETDLLIGSDIGNTQQSGDFVLFDAAGNEMDRFEVGILPSGFWAKAL